MNHNNNLNPLPFYDSLEKQNHRKKYAYNNVFPLYCELGRILPFQIVRASRSNAIASVLVYNIDGEQLADITDNFNDLIIVKKEGYDIIVNLSLFSVISFPKFEGQYYIRISDGVQYWFSEVFTCVSNIDCLLKVTYWDNENLVSGGEDIDFANQYKNYIYLPTEVGMPDYEFEEEGTERDGYMFVEKQISKKVYKFNFTAPEFLLDAMRIIRMCPNVHISNPNGDDYEAIKFLITPTWLDDGYLASVEAEFECDTIIKQIGSGLQPQLRGDFNGDFNNDFNI